MKSSVRYSMNLVRSFLKGLTELLTSGPFSITTAGATITASGTIVVFEHRRTAQNNEGNKRKVIFGIFIFWTISLSSTPRNRLSPKNRTYHWMDEFFFLLNYESCYLRLRCVNF